VRGFRRRWCFLGLFAWLPLSVAVLHCGRADAEPFQVEKLRVPGRVLGIKAEDLNGDKRRDLIVIFGTERERVLALFLDHGGSFSVEPDQTLVAPRNATFVDVGDLDGDGRQAIVFGDRRGLMALRLDASGKRLDPTPRRVLESPSLLSLAEDADLIFFKVLRDWDGDGKSEILLPQPDGLAVFTRGATGWTRAGEIRLHMAAAYAARTELYEPRLRNFGLRALVTVPELTVADFDGDGKPDLFALLEDQLEVHRGGGAALFLPVAAARLQLSKANETAHVSAIVRDLDGDGIADLVVNRISGGLGQMRALTQLYFGKKGGGFSEPAQKMEREGYAGSLSFGDLDGDGKPDLLMPHVDVGLADMARVLLSKRMTIGWEARRNRGREFSVVPETIKDVDFPVDFSQLADIDGPYPSVAGDFNGDGNADFIAANGPDSLAVWLGGGKSLIADSPKAIVHITPSKFFFITDLDGDKRADLVVFYRSRDAIAGTIAVARNSGRGW
jgi:hypothetical protein